LTNILYIAPLLYSGLLPKRYVGNWHLPWEMSQKPLTFFLPSRHSPQFQITSGGWVLIQFQIRVRARKVFYFLSHLRQPKIKAPSLPLSKLVRLSISYFYRISLREWRSFPNCTNNQSNRKLFFKRTSKMGK